MIKLILLLLCVILLASCAPEHIDIVSCSPINNPPGFWLGLWHGFISPITFIISLFNDSVEFYSVHNNGGWYNFGFVLGAGILFGSSSKASK